MNGRVNGKVSCCQLWALLFKRINPLFILGFQRRLAWAISLSTCSGCRAVTVRSRGFCPGPVVKPSFQVFSLSSKATNKVPSVVLSCTLRVAGVVMGFLLHSDSSRVMEKKLTNSGPLREPADKHSIYALNKDRHVVSWSA